VATRLAREQANETFAHGNYLSSELRYLGDDRQASA
jgi:hypothetical protein